MFDWHVDEDFEKVKEFIPYFLASAGIWYLSDYFKQYKDLARATALVIPIIPFVKEHESTVYIPVRNANPKDIDVEILFPQPYDTISCLRHHEYKVRITNNSDYNVQFYVMPEWYYCGVNSEEYWQNPQLVKIKARDSVIISFKFRCPCHQLGKWVFLINLMYDNQVKNPNDFKYAEVTYYVSRSGL